MFSKKGMKPAPQKIQEIREVPAPQNKKALQNFLGRTSLYAIIVHKHIIYENYCRRIKITYGQKPMSRLLTILNNF